MVVILQFVTLLWCQSDVKSPAIRNIPIYNIKNLGKLKTLVSKVKTLENREKNIAFDSKAITTSHLTRVMSLLNEISLDIHLSRKRIYFGSLYNFLIFNQIFSERPHLYQYFFWISCCSDIKNNFMNWSFSKLKQQRFFQLILFAWYIA